jgi:succinate dehydrogenase / fumarate reductase, membrane anchor subunit
LSRGHSARAGDRLGAAHTGVHHWWLQRLSSVALVPLGVWFVVSLLALPNLTHPVVVSWMAQAWSAPLLILLVLVAAWHSQLGVRVVIEDYVHERGTKTVWLVCMALLHGLLAVAGVFAILKVALGASG